MTLTSEQYVEYRKTCGQLGLTPLSFAQAANQGVYTDFYGNTRLIPEGFHIEKNNTGTDTIVPDGKRLAYTASGQEVTVDQNHGDMTPNVVAGLALVGIIALGLWLGGII